MLRYVFAFALVGIVAACATYDIVPADPYTQSQTQDDFGIISSDQILSRVTLQQIDFPDMSYHLEMNLCISNSSRDNIIIRPENLVLVSESGKYLPESMAEVKQNYVRNYPYSSTIYSAEREYEKIRDDEKNVPDTRALAKMQENISELKMRRAAQIEEDFKALEPMLLSPMSIGPNKTDCRYVFFSAPWSDENARISVLVDREIHSFNLRERK